MYRPLKRAEAAWNARTPEYLHNGTKANLIWQIKMTAALLLAMAAYEEAKTRLAARRYKPTYTEDHYPVN